MNRVETWVLVCSNDELDGRIHQGGYDEPTIHIDRHEAEREAALRDNDWCGPHRIAHLVEVTVPAVKLRGTGEAAAAARVTRCRECGCTDELPCEAGCFYVEPGLCSRCADFAVEWLFSTDFPRRLHLASYDSCAAFCGVEPEAHHPWGTPDEWEGRLPRCKHCQRVQRRVRRLARRGNRP